MKKCNQCGKLLKNETATHCSDTCLFMSIKKSTSVDKVNE